MKHIDVTKINLVISISKDMGPFLMPCYFTRVTKFYCPL